MTQQTITKQQTIPREVLIEVLVNYGIAGNELKMILKGIDTLLSD